MDNGSNTSNSNWSSNSSSYTSSSFISRKRSLSDGGGSTPPDDGDSNKRRRPNSVLSPDQRSQDLRFACPYYKRNPGRHLTFTSCRDPGFTTVARLKEHLYRRHLLPPQCHRCCNTFSDSVALRDHQRDPRGCEVRDQVPLEGFDKEQENRLKSKKKGKNNNHVFQTEEHKWKAVYRILFPDDAETTMPSPYIEYQPSAGVSSKPASDSQFQEFSRRELPRLVRRTLEVAIEKEAQPLEEKLKERLVDIVKECQAQLLRMFQKPNEADPAVLGLMTPPRSVASTDESANPVFIADCPASGDFAPRSSAPLWNAINGVPEKESDHLNIELMWDSASAADSLSLPTASEITEDPIPEAYDWNIPSVDSTFDWSLYPDLQIPETITMSQDLAVVNPVPGTTVSNPNLGSVPYIVTDRSPW